MREILEAYPGAQQALFQRYHIAGLQPMLALSEKGPGTTRHGA